MEFHDTTASHALHIDGITPKAIVINQIAYTPAVCLAHDVAHTIAMARPHDLCAADFQAALDAGAEVLLIGTGAKQQFLSPVLIAQIAQHGIGLECMNTAAAARTYTLLVSEGRRVWAWLWI